MQVNNYHSPPKSEKMSTIELKKALQKIKQTQLQVLSALKNEAQPLNLNESNVRLVNDNNQSNAPYMKSISHMNLLKMVEVNNMRKQFERERQKYQDKIANLQQKIKLLEGELALKTKLQIQWNNQRSALNSKVKQLQSRSSNKNINSETFIKAQVDSYKDELTQKIKDKIMMQNEINSLQIKIKEILEQNEMYRSKYERYMNQASSKQKNRPEKNIKMSQHLEKSRIPFEEMLVEVKRLTTNHEKLYLSFKSRARIAVTDLDTQQQIQQSFNKLSNLLENWQKKNTQEKKIIELDDSVIQGGKGYDSQSFRDEVKKFDKELFEHENLKKEIYDLKTEVLSLKERKNAIEFQLLKTKQNLSDNSNRLKKYQEKYQGNHVNQYQILINQLQTQMKKIREQKNILSSLVKKISENAFRSSDDDEFAKKIREQITKITQTNQKLRIQNQQYKLTINNLTLIIENMKYEESKVKNCLADQSKQKQSIIEQKNRLEKEINQKDSQILKHQQKINQLGIILQANLKKYEVDINAKLNESNLLRHDIQKQMKELRNLRETAYNYQLLVAQNQTLKRKLVQVNSTIIHLWEIKQAQYGNIYTILDNIKKT